MSVERTGEQTEGSIDRLQPNTTYEFRTVVNWNVITGKVIEIEFTTGDLPAELLPGDQLAAPPIPRVLVPLEGRE